MKNAGDEVPGCGVAHALVATVDGLPLGALDGTGSRFSSRSQSAT